MLFQLDKSEVRQLREPLEPHFTAAEMVIVTFRTDPRVVAEILPHPLKPAEEALGTAFVAWYPETNFGCIYHEGALFLHATHHGSPGLYCLSMPVDDDMAMIGGREIYGYPKKMGDISLEHDGDEVVGRVVRKGHEIMRVRCSLSSEMALGDLGDHHQIGEDDDGVPCVYAPSYLFKFFASPDSRRFDYLPRLVRQVNVLRPRDDLRGGEAELVLGDSPFDPLGDVPVGEVVAAVHGTWDNTMLPGRVVARTWRVRKFLPHAFFKADVAATRLGWLPPTQSRPSRQESAART